MASITAPKAKTMAVSRGMDSTWPLIARPTRSTTALGRPERGERNQRQDGYQAAAVRLLRVHVWVAMVRGRGVRPLDRARAGPADQVEDRARLVVGARCPRTAERLESHHGTGRLVIDVEVARCIDQGFGCLANRLPVAREDRARQPVRARAVDELEGVLKLSIGVRVHGEDGAELLLLPQLEVRIAGLDHRGADKPPNRVVPLAARDH